MAHGDKIPEIREENLTYAYNPDGTKAEAVSWFEVETTETYWYAVGFLAAHRTEFTEYVKNNSRFASDETAELAAKTMITHLDEMYCDMMTEDLEEL